MCRKKGSDIYRQVADEKKWKEQFQTQSVTTIPPSLCSVHRVHFLAPSLSLLMSCLRAPAKTPLMRNIRRRGWNSGERSGGQLTDKRLNTTLTKQGKEGGRRKRQINKWIWYKLSSSSLAQWCCHCCGRDGWLPRKKKDPRRPTTHTPDLRCSPRNTGMHTLNMHTYLGQRHEMHPHASSQCTYSRTHTHTHTDVISMWPTCTFTAIWNGQTQTDTRLPLCLPTAFTPRPLRLIAPGRLRCTAYNLSLTAQQHRPAQTSTDRVISWAC